jgi:hypothetical protein
MNANSLIRSSETPDAAAASGLSRAATMPRPMREFTRLRVSQNASTTHSATTA